MRWVPGAAVDPGRRALLPQKPALPDAAWLGCSLAGEHHPAGHQRQLPHVEG